MSPALFDRRCSTIAQVVSAAASGSLLRCGDLVGIISTCRPPIVRPVPCGPLPPAPPRSPPPTPPFPLAPTECDVTISFVRRAGGVTALTCADLANASTHRFGSTPGQALPAFECDSWSATRSAVSTFGGINATAASYAAFSLPSNAAVTFAEFGLDCRD
eukprot:96542-Chlamydomonas_euryale.AAC.1